MRVTSILLHMEVWLSLWAGLALAEQSHCLLLSSQMFVQPCSELAENLIQLEQKSPSPLSPFIFLVHFLTLTCSSVWSPCSCNKAFVVLSDPRCM